MIKKANSVILSFITVFSVLFILPQHLRAEISLSVNPHAGGSELDFGQLNQVYQEVSRQVGVEIRGTNTQYELRQEPLSPLRNARGDEIPWSNLTLRGLAGTNKFGRLQVNPEPVRNAVLYTANQDGNADSFTLVYTLKFFEGIRPDFYRGQLRFSVIPVNAGQSSVSAILNIVVVVKPETEAGVPMPYIEITTVTGSRFIYLNSKREESKRCDVLVKINGKFNRPFSIYQILNRFPESGEGQSLEPEAVMVEARGARVGAGLPLSALSLNPLVIYKSKPTGEADSGFIVSYSLGGHTSGRAGRYRSRIQFVLEEMGIERERQAMELDIEIERVFDLVITSSVFESGDIEFRGLRPGEPPQVNEVVVEILNNTGKRYQLNQNILSELVDKQGNKIESKYFTLRTESMQTKGILKATQKQEAGKGDTVLYISDSRGSSDKFKIIYELEGSQDIKAGDYASRISYSLLEL
ncbi:hypothetical protein EPN16_07620 [bacterium]|nr:MAG: hypothetical protein EPN16_07620 [bacterium]